MTGKRKVASLTRQQLRTRHKARMRAKRERELGKLQLALPGKQYGVIYADPPWRFEVWSRKTGLDRAADNHYPTLMLEDICTLKVPAARDCVLFLWSTPPMMHGALTVMCAWEFVYKSQFVWVKPSIGTGYWARAKHELLLIGIRGSIPAPAYGTQYPSVIEAPRGRHSHKPDIFRQMIETMFPSLPRIELFARECAPGWDVWGNEIDIGLRESLVAMEQTSC